MEHLTCEHISGQAFRPWFGRTLTPDGLEQMIGSAFDLAGAPVRRRTDGDHLYLDWEADGASFTAGLHAASLLFVSLRPREGALTSEHVIECMGTPAYYQAWHQFYRELNAGTVQVAMIFFGQRVVAYATRHYTSSALQAPALDGSLPIHLIGIFGQDWQEDPRALHKALPWSGWQNLEIETIGYQAIPAGSAAEPASDPEASSSPSLEDALTQVAAAFANAPRPSDAELLHSDAFDDNDIRALYGVSRWQELPESVIENEYAALAFLSPTGFRHFLPAYMSWALRHPDSGAAAVSSTIFALAPVPDEPLRPYMVSKFSLLNAAQQEAVVTFLRAMQDFEDVRAALAYWRTAPTAE